VSTITFDTLHFVSTLEQAGFDRKQAEGLALAQKEAMSEALDLSLATRSDVLSVSQAVRDLAVKNETELKLVKWMIGLSIALSASGFALMAKMLIELSRIP
jgi:hypothetical protein